MFTLFDVVERSTHEIVSRDMSRGFMSAMDSDTDVAIAIAVAACFNNKKKRKSRRRRSCWTRQWLLRRNMYGAYHCLLQELASEDVSSFRNFLRMEKPQFDELLGRVTPLIVRKNTNMREAISAAERLAITLRFLASGVYKCDK